MNIKRFGIVMLLALAGNFPIFAAAQEQATKPGSALASAPAASAPAASAPASADDWRMEVYEPSHVTIGSLNSDGGKGYLFSVQLTSKGAAVETLKLADQFATIQDRQLFDKVGAAEYQKVVKAPDPGVLFRNPKQYYGNYSLDFQNMRARR